MKFSQYFILISYLMAVTGLLSISLTNVISPEIFAGIAAIVLLSLFLSLKDKTLNIPKLVWNILAVVILFSALIDYLFLSNSLINVSARFLTILMVAKLFDLKTNRDYATLYLLTFFQLLSAATLTVNISFLLILALYILIGIWALTIFNLKKDWETHKVSNREIGKNIFGPSFFITTTGLAILSFIITLALFFVIPRMGIGFFSPKTADTLKISGFSEKIDLGDLGPVKLDPTIVMRVELSPPFSPALLKGGLYFRGISFDNYNGTQWQQTTKEREPLKKRSDGIFGLNIEREKKGNLLKQVILLEPIETDVLFAASAGIGIAGNFKSISGDTAGSFYLPTLSYSKIEYTAYSILPHFPPSPYPLPSGERRKVRGGLFTARGFLYEDHTEMPSLQYVQVPDGIEQIYTLAKDITNDKNNFLDKAIAIEEYLKNNYHYTLNPKKGGGENPIEDFLFYTKEGYCEQYATAMAVMLRTIGIPSRLVTGFLPGEWNRFGNYFIIRGRDAHSWVEAYIPGSDWVIFDPTPSAEAIGVIPQAASMITLYLDSLRWKWNKYIINYSLVDQMKLARTVEGKTRSLISNLRWETFRRQISINNIQQKYPLYIAVLIFIIILLKVGRLKKQKNWSKAPLFYKNMIRLLLKKRRIKKGGETALEFANGINIKEVQAITNIYYKIRFGSYKLTAKEKEDILAYVNAIKKAQKI